MLSLSRITQRLKTIRGARTITAEGLAAGQTAASRALSSAWKPREGSAAIANRIRNTCLRRDRIRRRGFKGVITDSVLVIDIRNLLPVAVLHDEGSINILEWPRRRESGEACRPASLLTVVLRQKRRIVTPITLQNARSTPCTCRALGLRLAEILRC